MKLVFSRQNLWGNLDVEDKSINNMASVSLGLKETRQSHVKCLELEAKGNALLLEQTEQTKPLSEFYLILHDNYTEHRHALLSTTERKNWTGMKKRGWIWVRAIQINTSGQNFASTGLMGICWQRCWQCVKSLADIFTPRTIVSDPMPSKTKTN